MTISTSEKYICYLLCVFTSYLSTPEAAFKKCNPIYNLTAFKSKEQQALTILNIHNRAISVFSEVSTREFFGIARDWQLLTHSGDIRRARLGVNHRSTHEHSFCNQPVLQE